MKPSSRILLPTVLLLAAASGSILCLPYLTHAQTGPASVLDAPALTADGANANRVELSWSAVEGAARLAMFDQRYTFASAMSPPLSVERTLNRIKSSRRRHLASSLPNLDAIALDALSQPAMI